MPEKNIEGFPVKIANKDGSSREPEDIARDITEKVTEIRDRGGKLLSDFVYLPAYIPKRPEWVADPSANETEAEQRTPSLRNDML